MPYRFWDNNPRFPRSQPRAAKGGIKAQSKRGGFGQSWWAKRWIGLLESFNIGARLGRGRSYARNGQVLSIDIAKGQVEAKVQGSRPKPYAVTIAVKMLEPGHWQCLIETLSSRAIFVAKLLAGEMPQDIEEVFASANLSLFPEREADLETDCSCPDWSNPCKHVAAVYYLLGEEFDRDPFLLFQLRGLGREELLARLSNQALPTETRADTPAAQPGEPLPVDPAQFWSAVSLTNDLFGAVQPPKVSAAWLTRLGSFPFWRGEVSLRDALESIYARAAKRGLAAFLGESSTQE
jgi:uncharacterized Zn finger protein